jgi:hypothetical protein
VSHPKYRITAAMLKAGASAMDQCRRHAGQTPESVCQAIFVAMVAAAEMHPGKSLARSFEWSPHDGRKGRGAVPGKLARADFDADGVRCTVLPDGTAHYQFIWNMWWLLKAWKAEQAAKQPITKL